MLIILVTVDDYKTMTMILFKILAYAAIVYLLVSVVTTSRLCAGLLVIKVAN